MELCIRKDLDVAADAIFRGLMCDSNASKQTNSGVSLSFNGRVNYF